MVLNASGWLCQVSVSMWLPEMGEPMSMFNVYKLLVILLMMKS